MIDFTEAPDIVAPKLLGCILSFGGVSIRITEVEAYLGREDEASHAYPGKTQRNKAMFGPPGRIYVYNSYGIHKAGNIVCWPADRPGAVLLRAGEVIRGIDIALRRRGNIHPTSRLAQGPGNFGKALGLLIEHNHKPVVCSKQSKPDSFTLIEPEDVPEYVTGRRIGITKNPEPKWRFWIPEDPTVSRSRGTT